MALTRKVGIVTYCPPFSLSAKPSRGTVGVLSGPAHHPRCSSVPYHRRTGPGATMKRMRDRRPRQRALSLSLPSFEWRHACACICGRVAWEFNHLEMATVRGVGRARQGFGSSKPVVESRGGAATEGTGRMASFATERSATRTKKRAPKGQDRRPSGFLAQPPATDASDRGEHR